MVAKFDALLAGNNLPKYVTEEIDGRIRPLQIQTSAMDQERLTRGRKPMTERPSTLPSASGETPAGNGIDNP